MMKTGGVKESWTGAMLWARTIILGIIRGQQMSTSSRTARGRGQSALTAMTSKEQYFPEAEEGKLLDIEIFIEYILKM